MSDSSIPADDLDLPDVSGNVDVAALDPRQLLEDLVKGNGQKIAELSGAGVVLADAAPLVSVMILQAYLEAVLRVLAGEDAVIAVGIDVNEKIAQTLAGAATEVAKAKLAAPLSALPPNGNRAARRHG